MYLAVQSCDEGTAQFFSINSIEKHHKRGEMEYLNMYMIQIRK